MAILNKLKSWFSYEEPRVINNGKMMYMNPKHPDYGKIPPEPKIPRAPPKKESHHTKFFEHFYPPSTPLCQKCKQELIEGAIFCGNCGSANTINMSMEDRIKVLEEKLRGKAEYESKPQGIMTIPTKDHKQLEILNKKWIDKTKEDKNYIPWIGNNKSPEYIPLFPNNPDPDWVKENDSLQKDFWYPKQKTSVQGGVPENTHMPAPSVRNIVVTPNQEEGVITTIPNQNNTLSPSSAEFVTTDVQSGNYMTVSGLKQYDRVTILKNTGTREVFEKKVKKHQKTKRILVNMILGSSLYIIFYVVLGL